MFKNFLVAFRRNTEQNMDSLLGHIIMAKIDVYYIAKDNGVLHGRQSPVKLLNRFRRIS